MHENAIYKASSLPTCRNGLTEYLRAMCSNILAKKVVELIAAGHTFPPVGPKGWDRTGNPQAGRKYGPQRHTKTRRQTIIDTDNPSWVNVPSMALLPLRAETGRRHAEGCRKPRKAWRMPGLSHPVRPADAMTGLWTQTVVHALACVVSPASYPYRACGWMARSPVLARPT
jgi:hypothetical protein